ncbi:hypothetical protein MKY41_01795 [Sporosarcina sp. FSL W7-1349]|uniref:hypothetical protein n=1 Tax=Sporosarcina sp. FSL W7-1349 TaxID=2921561 RepID=UPI0030FB12A2
MRQKAQRLAAQDALISAKCAEIRQVEPFAVRLAEAMPAESARLLLSLRFRRKRKFGTENNGEMKFSNSIYIEDIFFESAVGSETFSVQ